MFPTRPDIRYWWLRKLNSSPRFSVTSSHLQFIFKSLYTNGKSGHFIPVWDEVTLIWNATWYEMTLGMKCLFVWSAAWCTGMIHTIWSDWDEVTTFPLWYEVTCSLVKKIFISDSYKTDTITEVVFFLRVGFENFLFAAPMNSLDLLKYHHQVVEWLHGTNLSEFYEFR